MNAALQNTGIRPAEERREALAERGSTPAVRPKITVKNFYAKVGAEREAELAALAATFKVSRRCFI